MEYVWACLPRAQVLIPRHPWGCWLGPPAALHLQGGWGPLGFTMCCCSGAAVPACSLCRSPLGWAWGPSSRSAGPSSALPTSLKAKAAGTAQFITSCSDRLGWPHPPQPCAPGNGVQEIQATRAHAGRESTASFVSLWMLPGPEGPSQTGNCLRLGSLRFWNPGGPTSPRGTFLTWSWRFCRFFCVCVQLQLKKHQKAIQCTIYLEWLC